MFADADHTFYHFVVGQAGFFQGDRESPAFESPNCEGPPLTSFSPRLIRQTNIVGGQVLYADNDYRQRSIYSSLQPGGCFNFCEIQFPDCAPVGGWATQLSRPLTDFTIRERGPMILPFRVVQQ